MLARLDGVTTTDRGGVVLKLRDAFLKKSHAPVEVTVEAKDNDPLTGDPKWGASPPVTLIPPDVGEPEARRLDALRRVRDALVDTLAWRLSTLPPAEAAARKSFTADEIVAHRIRRTSGSSRRPSPSRRTAGVRVADRLTGAAPSPETEDAGRPSRAEARAPTATLHARVVQATEAVRARGRRGHPRPRRPTTAARRGPAASRTWPTTSRSERRAGAWATPRRTTRKRAHGTQRMDAATTGPRRRRRAVARPPGRPRARPRRDRRR